MILLSRRPLRVLLSLGVVLAVSMVPTLGSAQEAVAVGSAHAQISGVGSSWSSNAIDQWRRNVRDNYQWVINYDNSGSSAGRQQFGQGTADFGVSEIPYALANSDSPDPRPSRSFAYIPIVAGGTAFMYNLVIGGQRVTNLRLSGEVVSKIFTGVITKWNDPAIAADNPKLALPAITIVPVVRSDGSGTTAQLTSWMRSQFPSLWSAYCARASKANCGITSNYPIVPGSAFIAQSGSDKVAGFVQSDQAVGSITYVEDSYALAAEFPVVKVLNSAGYYTEPNASNVAVSLLAAVINNDAQSPDYLTANLSGVYVNPDPRTYPLSSYSYMLIPTALEGSFTEDKGLTLADFASYFLCEGQQQAEVLGYSPLPINLASAGLEQILKIPGGNPINKSIVSCNNPTFSTDGTNKVATTAPQPQACDKKGPDQCATGTGGAAGTQTAASSGSAGGPVVGGSKGTNSPTDGPLQTGGEAVGLSGGGDPVVAGSPVDLPQRGIPMATLAVMILAVVSALVAVLLPPVIARRRAGVMASVPRAAKSRVRQRGPSALTKWKIWMASTPRVHLRAPFTKGGSAELRSGGS